MTTRRTFFRRTAFGLAGASAFASGPGARAAAAADRPNDPFHIGMAGYTFRKFSLEQTLEALKKVDVRYLCIKDFHLPLASTDAEIAAFHATCAKYDVTGYGVGPIYMETEEAVDQAFDYARRVGVKIIVGVPCRREGKKRVESPELLKVVERKVREYDVKYAIHNHGPDNAPYPTAGLTMDYIRDLDRRIGICLDIGHNLRYGVCPNAELEAFADRIHDLHLKDVTAADKSGTTVQLGRGLIDIPQLVRILRKIGYAGVCSLEYERDADDPTLGVAESIGYFRGVLDAV